MTDQKQENKKLGLIKKILKWIGKGILTLLLILSLIFQAPWKIIALLAVFFAACFILPKRMRKWFWRSVSAVVLILFIWVFLPEDDTGWRPYTFDEEIAAFRAKYAVPDEENAAFAYGEIFESLDIDTNQPEFFVRSSPSSQDEPWTSKDHPEMADWLKGHQDTIEKLMQASRKEKCVFSINFDPFQLPNNSTDFSNSRNCFYLLIVTANNDIAEGRTGQAIEKLICISNIAAHFQQQPSYILHGLGAYETRSLSGMNRLILEGNLTNEQLQIISESIRQIESNWNEYLKNFLDFEKLYCKNGLAGQFYERDSNGKSRITRSPLFGLLEQNTSEVDYTRRKFAKLGVILLWLYLPSSPQKVSELVDQYSEKYYAMLKPDFDWNLQPDSPKENFTFNFCDDIEIAVFIMNPDYHEIYEKYMKILTLRRGLHLLIALRQYKNEHGSWPPDLDSIKTAAPAEAFLDPVTGELLQYENHGERFSLYGEKTNVWPG